MNDKIDNLEAKSTEPTELTETGRREALSKLSQYSAGGAALFFAASRASAQGQSCSVRQDNSNPNNPCN